MANKQPLFLFVEFLKSETTGLLHIKKFDVDNAFPESFTYVSYDEYCRVIESLRRENEELKAKLDKAKDALRFYGDNHPYPNDGPFGTGSTDFGHRARTTLEEIEK